MLLSLPIALIRATAAMMMRHLFPSCFRHFRFHYFADASSRLFADAEIADRPAFAATNCRRFHCFRPPMAYDATPLRRGQPFRPPYSPPLIAAIAMNSFDAAFSRLASIIDAIAPACY